MIVKDHVATSLSYNQIVHIIQALKFLCKPFGLRPYQLRDEDASECTVNYEEGDSSSEPQMLSYVVRNE